MKVDVQSKKLVRPSAPTPNQHRKLGLSFIDDLLFSGYVGAVFCYRAREGTHEMDALQRFQRLEESLSETLTLFYPLAGRLVEDGLFIDCNNRGVEFVQAEVDGALDQLLQGDPDRDLLGCLSQFPPQAATNPPVIVQVSSFNCGGLAIGLRFSHKIADMYTMATFMNSWATACRSGIHEVVPPSFELPSLFPVKEPSFLQWSALSFGDNVALARLRFSGLALSRLKAACNASDSLDSTANDSQRSRVEIVTALICKALVSVDHVTKGPPRPFAFSAPINLRGRVQLKIPANACGNFVGQFTPTFTVEEREPSFNGMLNLVGDVYRNAKLKYATIADTGMLCSMVADSFRELIDMMVREEVNMIPIDSWCRFPIYDADFGWGKPDLVSNAGAPLRSACLVDSPIDGGIDALITLNQDEMVLFKQDPDVVACTS